MYRKFASLFVGKADHTFLQLFRYTLVGGLAFLVDYGSLLLLKEMTGMHYLWAAAIAFTFGVVTNYCLSIKWVFDKRIIHSQQVEFLIFAILGILGLGINELVMFALTSGAGLHYLGSKLVSTGITFGWNFISRKILLFSVQTQEQEANEPPISSTLSNVSQT
jgi:putative flippase GtrA